MAPVDSAALARLIGQKYRQAEGTRASSNSSSTSATSTKSNIFAQTLKNVSLTPLKYEDGELLDRALSEIPLETLFMNADKRESEDDSWSSHDYLIMELLSWFKKDYFKWVNSPVCSSCGGETSGIGSDRPTGEELHDGAGSVELHRCKTCKHVERFPRYNLPGKLLSTRRGRCGEWANCFTLLCRALGSRVRYIWNSEDHVWTEVYSEKQKRWVHADSCEDAWDNPMIYGDGWGKKMAYVIAFSRAVDVTPKYVRQDSKALPRDKISEPLLKSVLKQITEERRIVLAQDIKARLETEDELEKIELASYISSPTTTRSEVGPRQSGSQEWTKQRGEDGS